MASFKGRVTFSADEIKQILSAELDHRFGIKADTGRFWLGLKQANNPECEAFFEFDEAKLVSR